jgi:hypothetical protein
MHAVVTNVTINDATVGTARLRDEIVPRLAAAPGFVAGYWVRLPDNKGSSTAVFESETAAQAMVDMIRGRPEVDDSVTIDSMEIGEVVANA